MDRPYHLIFPFVIILANCGTQSLQEIRTGRQETSSNAVLSNVDSLIKENRLSIKRYDHHNLSEHQAFIDLVKKTNKEIEREYPGQGVMIGAIDRPYSFTFALFLDKRLVGTAWYFGDGLASIVIDPRARSKGLGKYLFIESMTDMMQQYQKLELRNDAKELGDYLYGTLAKHFFETQLFDKNKYVYQLYKKDYYKQKINEVPKENWWLSIYKKLLNLHR